MGVEKNPEDSRISHIGTLFIFSVQVKKKLLLSLLKSGSSLKYPFAFWRFYKVIFESIVYFGNIRINCKGVQSVEICHFETILIQKTAFSTTKVEVTEPELRRIYLHTIPD